jgi:hypothetical protein
MTYLEFLKVQKGDILECISKHPTNQYVIIEFTEEDKVWGYWFDKEKDLNKRNFNNKKLLWCNYFGLQFYKLKLKRHYPIVKFLESIEKRVKNT